MNIFTDSLYRIGSSHKVCEDYALNDDEKKIIIVSDGCSGANNSDIGARIIAQSAVKVIKASSDEELYEITSLEFTQRINAIADKAIQTLGMNKACLSATLLVAFYIPSIDIIRVIIVGDGFLFLKITDTDAKVFKSDFSKDYPLYPAYLKSSMHYEQYVKAQSLASQIIDQDWIDEKAPENIDLNIEKNVVDLRINANELEWLMLSSDGISTFQDLLFVDVLTNTCAIKSMQGEFVKRRANKMLNKEFANHNHTDDFSLAGISIVRDVK